MDFEDGKQQQQYVFIHFTVFLKKVFFLFFLKKLYLLKSIKSEGLFNFYKSYTKF